MLSLVSVTLSIQVFFMVWLFVVVLGSTLQRNNSIKRILSNFIMFQVFLLIFHVN